MTSAWPAYLGQDAQEQVILNAAAGPRMHHGWILAGPRGIGKAHFARTAARRLLADAAGPPIDLPGLAVPDDHPVARLFQSGAHPDYAELERLETDTGDRKRNISIDQVRQLQRMFATVPSLSQRRVVVIDSADDLERNAANALLKNLEEPPLGTIFFLVSHATARLLPTIRSRCRILRFPALPDALVRRIVQEKMADTPAEEIDALVTLGKGSPGRALTFGNSGAADVEKALRAILSDGDPGNIARLALARSMATKAGRPRYEAMLERAPSFIADVARSRAGGPMRDALDAWEQARQLASGAVLLSLDPASVAFELGSLVAGLAEEGAR
jgi:DNA polymerase-3 subunit delta'